MVNQEVTIENAAGLHARPAQLFVQKASQFQSNIQVIKDTGAAIDAKSILGVMSLALGKGSKITIQAEGTDEQEALHTLAELVESIFGEE